MNQEAALALITDIIADRCGVLPAYVRPEMHLADDLGLDSIDLTELVVTVQRDTDQVFDLQNIEDLNTVGSVAGALSRALVDAEVAR